MGNCTSSDNNDREDSLSESRSEEREEPVHKTAVQNSTASGLLERFPFVEKSHNVDDVWKLFDIEKELGRGASCRVVKAKRKGDGRVFAVKEMRRDDKWNPMLFEQEVDILSKLAGHKNILHYEDCYIDNKNFYVLTSLCTGGELFDKIKELRHFSERQAVDVTKTILDAMNYCHDHNIVHRDLKPENIVYKDKSHEELVIIDFGDAKEVKEDSKHDDFVGTAFYLAPEAIRTRMGWELKKSDMWTIGVITYVLVTGRPPFWGRENKEIIRKIIRGNVRFPSTIKLSEKCKDFILKLLRKDPKERMNAAEALQHPWIKGGDAEPQYGEEILHSLATFGSANQLKRLIVTTVAANLDRKHRREYERQFAALDLKKDNQIDHEELTAFLMKNNVEPDEASRSAARIVENISGDESRPISPDDWNHANVAKLLSSDHLISRQYKKLDVDEDGVISEDDLLSIFDGVTIEKIQEMIDEIDLDEDGTINFEEFTRAMQFEPAYVSTY